MYGGGTLRTARCLRWRNAAYGAVAQAAYDMANASANTHDLVAAVSLGRVAPCGRLHPCIPAMEVGFGRAVASHGCTAAHPRYPGFAKRNGASFFETTMRPNPIQVMEGDDIWIINAVMATRVESVHRLSFGPGPPEAFKRPQRSPP